VSGGEAIGEGLIAEWLAARLWVDSPGGPLELEQGGVASPERFPEGVAQVHFVTAWNPGALPLAAEENARRHALLVRELDAAGTEHWAAAGYAPDLSWVEHGLALPDLAAADACALGLRHGQLALYAWRRDHLQVVGCRSGAVLASSRWSARGRPAPPG